MAPQGAKPDEIVLLGRDAYDKPIIAYFPADNGQQHRDVLHPDAPAGMASASLTWSRMCFADAPDWVKRGLEAKQAKKETP